MPTFSDLSVASSTVERYKRLPREAKNLVNLAIKGNLDAQSLVREPCLDRDTASGQVDGAGFSKTFLKQLTGN